MAENGDPLPAATRRTDQTGYVLPATALLLVPLVIFVAFTVDVGSWYAEADRAQKAADAAALAGTPMLFNEASALAQAKDIAARNGIVDQPGCDSLPCTPSSYPQVVATRIDTYQMRVDVLSEADMIFGQVVTDEPVIVQRSATAELAPSLPLGNPTSMLGAAADPHSGGYQANYWLRSSTDCAPRAWGDLIGAGGGCPNGNPNHRDEGHTFIVDVPLDGTWTLQARATCWESGSNQATGTMRFRLFPSDDTELNDYDNTLLAPMAETVVGRPDTSVCAANGSDWHRTFDPAPWVDIGEITSAGRYVLQEKNIETAANRQGTYSLRIVPRSEASTPFYSCSRVGPTGSSGCPNLQAKDYFVPMFSSDLIEGGVVGEAEIYLASIDDAYAGRTMRIELFDPAEGIDFVRIVDPHGNYAPFTWFTGDCLFYSYACARGDYGSPSAQISQSCGGESCLQQGGGYGFGDRIAFLDIELPTGYECAEPDGEPEDCWWKVEYSGTSAGADTTTFGVTMLGGPLHLIE